jgi:uncharacterized integral membrane protein
LEQVALEEQRHNQLLVLVVMGQILYLVLLLLLAVEVLDQVDCMLLYLVGQAVAVAMLIQVHHI